VRRKIGGVNSAFIIAAWMTDGRWQLAVGVAAGWVALVAFCNDSRHRASVEAVEGSDPVSFEIIFILFQVSTLPFAL
jgi:hypothetical protein